MSRATSISPAPSTVTNAIRRASDTGSAGLNTVERDSRTLVFNSEIKKSAGFFSRALNWLLSFFCFRPSAERRSNLSAQSPSLAMPRAKAEVKSDPVLNPLKAKLCNNFCDRITKDFRHFARKTNANLVSPASTEAVSEMLDHVCEDYRKRFLAEFDKTWPKKIFSPTDALREAYHRTAMLGEFNNYDYRDLFNNMRTYYESDFNAAVERHSDEMEKKFPTVHDYCYSIVRERMDGCDEDAIAKLKSGYLKKFKLAYQEYSQDFHPKVAICAAHMRATKALKKDLKHDPLEPSRESPGLNAESKVRSMTNATLKGMLTEIRREFGIGSAHASDARNLVSKKRGEE